jgi:hypothetical protein
VLVLAITSTAVAATLSRPVAGAPYGPTRIIQRNPTFSITAR